MPEEFRHRRKPGEWDVEKGTLLIKATLQHNRVEVRVPPPHVPRTSGVP
jgi:hypothetical protein